MNEKEIIKICNRVFGQMYQKHRVMNMGELQSVAKFVDLLEAELKRLKYEKLINAFNQFTDAISNLETELEATNYTADTDYPLTECFEEISSKLAYWAGTNVLILENE